MSMEALPRLVAFEGFDRFAFDAVVGAAHGKVLVFVDAAVGPVGDGAGDAAAAGGGGDRGVVSGLGVTRQLTSCCPPVQGCASFHRFRLATFRYRRFRESDA